MTDSWDDLASWWAEEARDDPAYPRDVHPLLAELLPARHARAIDLGCGEGQGMAVVGGTVIGVDLSRELARMAAAVGPTIVGRLPDLRFLRDGCCDLVVSVYVLDLLEDHPTFFRETARVTSVGGSLVVVINHPVYTAPGAAPLMDPDGEVLWRWGRYFARGSSVERAGHRTITYHHRPLAEVLTSAAGAGWSLDRMEERALSADTIASLPGYEGQDHIPRLLGVRWTRRGNVHHPSVASGRDAATA